jgi:hypothetical protein
LANPASFKAGPLLPLGAATDVVVGAVTVWRTVVPGLVTVLTTVRDEA